MAVGEDVARIAGAAEAFAAPGERLSGIVVAEPLGRRIYLCAYESEHGHGWLALDADAAPVSDRRLVQEAASLAALCEVAEESAGGGDLDALRARLAELRETDAPEGIDEAEEAAAALAGTLRPAPRIARAEYLDEIGVAARRLEQALGEDARSPFAAAMQQAMPAVEELTADVERSYKGPLA
ncbi:MAG TPA: hypothetical protein VFJ91_11110 [Gaiellaceae bacterium]|nr:hypothetical protein [Gaiellaceae bacterium]